MQNKTNIEARAADELKRMEKDTAQLQRIRVRISGEDTLEAGYNGRMFLLKSAANAEIPIALYTLLRSAGISVDPA